MRRQRIDELLDRVSAAREEIVEAGLDAVRESRAADEAPRGRRFVRRPKKADEGEVTSSARPSRGDA
jgi:hypothetical protein